MPAAVFTVKHNGRSAVASAGKEKVEQFWDALVLEGGPRPAVVAAVTGVYLITEEAGRPRVETLAPPRTDTATLQWLDAAKGQPAAPRVVTIRLRTGEPRTLGGGTLLLLNGEAVLDVKTLRAYPVSFSSPGAELDGYSGSNEQVRAVSPGRTQLVVVGSRHENDRYEYALIAADYASGRVYAVPFDRTSTRVQSVWDATPDWFAHSFEWTRRPDGAERITARKSVAPRPWQERFARSGGTADYRLEPVGPAMLEEFLRFLERDGGAVIARDGADRATATVEGWPLRVWHRPEDKSVSLYAEASRTGSTAPAHALIEKLGQRFNAALARGRYQHTFTNVDGLD